MIFIISSSIYVKVGNSLGIQHPEIEEILKRQKAIFYTRVPPVPITHDEIQKYVNEISIAEIFHLLIFLYLELKKTEIQAEKLKLAINGLINFLLKKNINRSFRL